MRIVEENPIVSVHVISYNQVDCIREALDSILAQEVNFSYEIVIGDDCSTDGTAEIVREYHETHPDLIRLVTHEHNVGALRNDYDVTMACNGKYIAYCEGDDYWHSKDKLRMQVELIENSPSCGIVHSEHDRYFEEYGVLVPCFFKTTGNSPPRDLNLFRGWNGYHIQTCTVLLDTALAKSVIQDKNIYLNDDHECGTDIPMFIEVAMQSGLEYIDKSLSTYRVRKESWSNTRSIATRLVFSRSSMVCYHYLARKYENPIEIEYFSGAEVEHRIAESMWMKDKETALKLKDKSSSKKARVFLMGAQSSFIRLLIVMYMQIKAWRTRSALRRNVIQWGKIGNRNT